jgi:hypothetical protein
VTCVTNTRLPRVEKDIGVSGYATIFDIADPKSISASAGDYGKDAESFCSTGLLHRVGSFRIKGAGIGNR